MIIKKFSLNCYRNIREMKLMPCDTINIIYGDNAQGKTNLIEAIWLFTGNPSFRGSKAADLISFDLKDGEFTRLSVDFEDKEREQNAELVLVKEGQLKKKTFLNKVPLYSPSELHGSFFCVVFSPSHLSLIKDGPRERRSFLDSAVSQINKSYESYLVTYERILQQRNCLLKSAYSYNNIKKNMELWDIQLAKTGTAITCYRNDYLKKLEAAASKIYGGLTGKKEKIRISYQSTVFENASDICSYNDENIEVYMKKLSYSFDADVAQGFTSCGIHRDDIDIFVDERFVKTYGSQGQQRSAVIAIKLAEAKLLKAITGENPIILLDDVMSELDIKRQDYILNHVKDLQVFITCCDPLSAKGLQKGRIFNIKEGSLAGQEEI